MILDERKFLVGKAISEFEARMTELKIETFLVAVETEGDEEGGVSVNTVAGTQQTVLRTLAGVISVFPPPMFASLFVAMATDERFAVARGEDPPKPTKPSLVN